MTTIEHLYIHIPFCTGKCSYCSFFSQPYSEDIASLYIDKIIKELKYYQTIYKEQLTPKTIYIGGGTPTTLNTSQMAKLLTCLSEFKNVREFTIETNPDLLSEEKLLLFKQYGVNRISIGVQSLDDDVLKYLNRRHTASDVEITLELLKRYEFENVSIDLISSLPNVSKEDWEKTIEKVSSWDGVKHISVYCLSIEDGTSFSDMLEKGVLIANTDDQELEMGQVARRLLEARGFSRYEISNYAQSGLECAHNLAYWHGKDFLGIGAGASSRLGLERSTNVESIQEYIDTADFISIKDIEILSETEDITERIMFNLRLESGILYSINVPNHILQKLDELIKLDLLELSNGYYKVKSDKRELTNSICEYLL